MTVTDDLSTFKDTPIHRRFSSIVHNLAVAVTQSGDEVAEYDDGQVLAQVVQGDTGYLYFYLGEHDSGAFVGQAERDTRPGSNSAISTPDTDSLSKSYLRMYYESAVRAALNAARNWREHDDGGTCNFDKPYVRPGNEKVFKQAVGVVDNLETSDGYGIAEGALFVLRATHGQGSRRTKMAKAFANRLNSFGIKASVFYKMD